MSTGLVCRKAAHGMMIRKVITAKKIGWHQSSFHPLPRRLDNQYESSLPHQHVKHNLTAQTLPTRPKLAGALGVHLQLPAHLHCTHGRDRIVGSPVFGALLIHTPPDDADQVVDAGGGVVLVEDAPSVQGQLHGGVDAAGDGAPLVDLGLHGCPA